MIASAANPARTYSPTAQSKPVRVAIICDFVEENWPSMDLVGNMLHANLREHHDSRIVAQLICPRLPFATGGQADMLSRLFGRLVIYPRKLRSIRNDFDVFHIVDHSYAHLAHELPSERTILTCHDIDAFRCLLHGGSRSFFFRAMARRILSGLRRAAFVTCDTDATRCELTANNLVSGEKLVVVHNGVHPALHSAPDVEADAEIARLLGRPAGMMGEIIHVGSTIPRKRIDVLLNAFAEVRRHRPNVRLLRVGGPLTENQRQLASSLGILSQIDALPRLSESLLAAAYRRADLLMMTSESEGFGLPVIEAMACGTPVIASDIAPLREIGGDAASYCASGDPSQFAQQAIRYFREQDERAEAWHVRRENCITQSSQFSWSAYAAKMAEIYERVIP